MHAINPTYTDFEMLNVYRKLNLHGGQTKRAAEVTGKLQATKCKVLEPREQRE